LNFALVALEKMPLKISYKMTQSGEGEGNLFLDDVLIAKIKNGAF
jgi:hypothetical protein